MKCYDLVRGSGLEASLKWSFYLEACRKIPICKVGIKYPSCVELGSLGAGHNNAKWLKNNACCDSSCLFGCIPTLDAFLPRNHFSIFISILSWPVAPKGFGTVLAPQWCQLRWVWGFLGLPREHRVEPTPVAAAPSPVSLRHFHAAASKLQFVWCRSLVYD